MLLTDGDNNAGYIPPLTAAELARKYGIRVYTIGVGTDGFAKMPFMQRANGEMVYRNVRVEINEELLNQIAEMTGGRYFRAKSTEVLLDADAIDELEKDEIEITTISRTSEAFYPFVEMALAFILLEWLAMHLFIRRLPYARCFDSRTPNFCTLCWRFRCSQRLPFGFPTGAGSPSGTGGNDPSPPDAGVDDPQFNGRAGP